MKHITVLFLFLQILAFPAFAQEYEYHVVQPGETVYSIARQYGITEETIYKYNPDAREGLKLYSKLVVPVTEVVEEIPQKLEFKEHRVRRRETLFSLSQRYNVSIEDIKRFNKHLYSEELRRGERIRIPIGIVHPKPEPIEEPRMNPLDLSTKEHVVLPKETWFGISRKYNITINSLKKLNPGVTVLQPGMVLRVKNGKVEKVVDVEGNLFAFYLVKPKETLFSLTRRFGVSRDSLEILNPALVDGLKSGMVLKIPNAETKVYGTYSEEPIVNLEWDLTNFEPKNLVVMLPFHLDRIKITDTSDNRMERVKRDKVLQIALDFYSGVLMAIDSASTLGISTNLRTFDTRRDPRHLDSILRTTDFWNTDAVIGPLVQSTVKVAVRGLQEEGVPVVAPFATEPVDSLDNYLQTRSTDAMLSDAMISYLNQNKFGKNLVIIADSTRLDKRMELIGMFPEAKIVNPQEGSYIDQEELKAALVEDLPNWIILEGTKIGVISNTTSYLNSLADTYPITLFTTEKNSSFDSDNISNMHLSKLNFHYPSIDRIYSPKRHAGFINKYQETHGVVPSRYAVRGFDVTYDVLLRLATAGDLYSSLEREGTTQYVESKFDYDQDPQGGFQNIAFYIMAYDKGLELNVIR